MSARLPLWLDRTLSGWLLFWVSLIVVYNHAGAYGYAGLVVLIGAAGWIVLLRNIRMRGRAILFGLAWSFLFCWMVITTRWGPEVPGAGLQTALRLAGQMALMIALPAYFMTRSDRVKTVLAHILMATALGGLAVIVADIAFGFGLSLAIEPVPEGGTAWRRQSDIEMNLGRGLVAWTILTPLLIGLAAAYLRGAKAWVFTVALLMLLVVAAWLDRLYAPVLILAAALPFYAITRRWPETGLKLSTGSAALAVLAAPMIGWVSGLVPESLLARLPLSWDHRLRMWDYTLGRILERPLTGHGLDASRVMQDSFTTRIGVDIPYISLHPHNVGLQIWLELGAVGVIFAIGAILSAGFAARRLAGRDPRRAAALAGVIGSAVGASLITVGAWQYWWWALIMVGATLVTLLPQTDGTGEASVDA